MTDITNPRLLWIKFGLFVLFGSLAATIALLLFPSIRLAVLLAITIWAFCRAYYFAFYVIQHYADPTYRYAGLLSFVRYAMSRKGENREAR